MTSPSDSGNDLARIVVTGVSKRFGGLQAVDDVSFEAEAAQLTGLIGPNGAGKSTLFNMMTNVLPPDSGSVSFGGTSISGLEAQSVVRLGVGRTFQTPRVFPSLTVLENLTIARDDPEQGLLRSLLGGRSGRQSSVSMAEEILNRIGLDGQGTRSPANLSGGELRLLEIGRQLMRAPRYILLDEPTAGVSPAYQHKLTSLLRGLREDGCTLICVEHNLGFLLELADKLVVLKSGAVIAAGTPQDVLSHSDVKDAYLGTKGTPHA